MRVAILSPTGPPAPGGASQWLEQLGIALANHPRVKKVVGFTEQHPRVPNHSDRESLKIQRIFPFRAGAEKSGMLSYWAYARTQLRLARLLMTHRTEFDCFLVHGSFYYHPTVLSALSRVPRERRPPILVDVRDVKVSEVALARSASRLGLISCSDAATDRLRELGVEPLSTIPIPFKPPRTPTRQEVAEALVRLQVRNQNFVLFTNGTSADKGIRAAVDLVARLRSEGLVDGLVVTGRLRETSRELAAAEDQGWVEVLGVVDHADLMCLLRASRMLTVLSTVEGLPRICLEAFSLKTRVLVPSNVPEFNRNIQECCCDPRDLDNIYDVAKRVLRATSVVHYPTPTHRPDRVAARYVDAVQDALSSSGSPMA